MPTDKTYIVGTTSWIYPYEGEVPRGCKIHILNQGGVSIIGHWDHTQGHIAWAPLHKRDAVKEKFQQLINSGISTEDAKAKVLYHTLENIDTSQSFLIEAAP